MEPPRTEPVFTTGRHRIAVVIRHGVLPLELGLVHQLFGSATARDGEPLYEVATCAPEPGLIRTDADFPVHVSHPVRTALEQADTVIVPASHEEHDDRHLYTPLQEAARRGVRIASICTGAFVLAAAGLLDSGRATTHWKSTELFRRRFPAVTLDPDVLYTDNGSVLTSAGEAAGIDLSLHMIRCDHGAGVANDVARSTVVPPHREGGQAQFIPRPVPAPGAVSSTGRARAWALAHLDRPISLRELADQESTSVRTLSRRFREESGLTPVQWLTRQRLGRARQLLEETDLPVDRVAADSGFGTGTSLRQHMNAALGVSPRAYRATFRGTTAPGT